MEYVHCKRCGHWPQLAPEVKTRFFLAACGQLYCQNCLTGLNNKCGSCQTECRILEVNSQSTDEVKSLFMDPLQSIKECIKKPVQIIQFQQSLQRSTVRLCAKMYQAVKFYKNETEVLKSEMEKLRTQNEELTRKLQQLTKQQRQSLSNANSCSNFLNQSPLQLPNSDPLNLFSEPSSTRPHLHVQPIPQPTSNSEFIRPSTALNSVQSSVRRNANTPTNSGCGTSANRNLSIQRQLFPTSGGVNYRQIDSALQSSSQNDFQSPCSSVGSTSSSIGMASPLFREPHRIMTTPNHFGTINASGTPTPRLISRLRNMRCSQTPHNR